MDRLFRRIVFLFLLCLIGVIGARFAGAFSFRSTTYDRLANLYLDDCLRPCWIGIMPGQTSVEMALKYIQAKYDIPQNKRVSIKQNKNRIQVEIYRPAKIILAEINIIGNEEGIVSHIRFGLYDSELQDFLPYLGYPRLINKTDDNGYYSLHYGGALQIAEISGWIGCPDSNHITVNVMEYSKHEKMPSEAINSLSTTTRWNTFNHFQEFVCK